MGSNDVTHKLSITRAEWLQLLRSAEAEGISRRQLLTIFTAGGFAAVLAACQPAPGDESASGDAPLELPWVKDPEPFIRHPTNLETRLELLDDVITPNELFFVRNHAPTPRIDPATWRLRVGGEMAEREIELTLEDLEAMAARSVVAYIECAGNWRSFWQPLCRVGGSDAGRRPGRGGCASGYRRRGSDRPGRRGLQPGHAGCARARPFHPARAPDEWRAAPSGSRISRTRGRPGLGRKQQREMARRDQADRREGVVTEPHDLVRADRGGLAGCGVRPRRRRADHHRCREERLI